MQNSNFSGFQNACGDIIEFAAFSTPLLFEKEKGVMLCGLVHCKKIKASVGTRQRTHNPANNPTTCFNHP